MTDLSQMIRWNANFVRGLAQSVLDRAKVIRTSLVPYATGARDAAAPVTPSQVKMARPVEMKTITTKKKITVKKSAKRTSAKKPTARKTKRTNG